MAKKKNAPAANPLGAELPKVDVTAALKPQDIPADMEAYAPAELVAQKNETEPLPVTGEVVSLTPEEMREERKRKIEAIRMRASLSVKESNLQNVDLLNRSIEDGIVLLNGAIQSNEIFQSISSSKELADSVKALKSMQDMRDDMLDRCIDDENAAKGKKGMKVSVEFSNQGVSVSMSGNKQ